jgi:DtxR family transcriptional regulator, Mn-dependent transcriptional regulator
MTETGDTVSDELLEDCLQGVHRLATQGQAATRDAVATFARTGRADVDRALAELHARGLVGAEDHGCITLTDDGRQQAIGILRRHRLSERLLTDVLGLPWDRVHDEAMRLEHALTPEAEARLAALLQHPETCPHGGPIPGSEVMPRTAPAPLPVRTLDRVPAGTRVRITQVAEEEATFLRYLASLGLLPQALLTVEEVAPFGGPLLVRLGGARYALGREIAAKIQVGEA